VSEPERTVGLRVLQAWAAPWRDRIGAVALGLLVVQGIARGAIVAHGYFSQDDFLMLSLGHAPLSWGMLFQDYSGQLFPGGFLVASAQAHAAPLDWTVGVVVILLMQAASGVMMWLAIRRFLGSRWIAIPLYAVFLFSPLTLWATQWWAVSLQILPLAFFLALAVWSFLVHLQDGARAGGVACVLATAAALLFQERGLLVVIVLLWIAVACTAPARWWRRIATALRADRWIWVSYVVLVIGYLVLHSRLVPVTTSPVDTPRDAAQLGGNLLGRNLLVGIFGGSWTRRISGDSQVVPSWWAVGACLAVLLALVVWTIRRGGFTSACGWALILSYAVADVGLLVWGGRAGGGPADGLVPRYAADAVPAVVVGLAIVALGVAEHGVIRARRRPAWLPALLLTAAYLASAAVSTSFLAPHQFSSEARRYVEAVRAGLRAEPQTVLYDGPVPAGVMSSSFGRDARLSTVLGIAPEAPVFDLPSYRLRMPDQRGRLRPLELRDTVTSEPSEDVDCGYHATSSGVRVPLTAPISAPTSGPGLVMRVGYYSGQPGFLSVSVGGPDLRVPVRTNLQDVDLVVNGSFDSVDLTFDSDGTVCVTDVTVGFPAAGPS
jgi:hypothetical protein